MTNLLNNQNIMQHQTYINQVSKQQSNSLGWSFNKKQDVPRLTYFKLLPITPKQVRVKILYTSLSINDIKVVRKGLFDQNKPFILGHEAIGTVQQIGSQVHLRRVGQVVGIGFFKESCNKCKQCIKGLDHLCTGLRNNHIEYSDGCLATRININEDWAFPLPNNIKLECAASLMCTGVTAFHPLITYLKKGDKVAIVGMTPLGTLALQFAAKLGYCVTVFSINEGDCQSAKNYGAKQFIIYKEQNMKKQQKQYQLVIYTHDGTNQQFERSLKLTKSGYRFFASTQIKFPQLKFTQVVTTQRQLHFLRSSSKQMTYKMLKFASYNQIQPNCEHFNFEDFPKVLQKLEKKQIKNQVVLKISQK